MKGIKAFAVLLAGVLLVGCASKPSVVTDHDTAYNFSALRSFHISTARQDAERSVLISPFTFSHLHNVMETELAQRYQRADAETADFLVSYYIVLEERLEVRTYDHRYGFGYYGYGYRHRPYPYYYHPHFYAPGPVPRVYRQGSLIVDIVDGKTQEPIWRGVSSNRLRDRLSPQEQRQILSAAVREILGNFPPVN